MPFTQHFSLVRNSILTDIFELVDFKPIRRLKKGEKLWALDIPKKEDTLEVNRIKCVILDAPAEKKDDAAAEEGMKDDAAAEEGMKDDAAAEEKKDESVEMKDASGTEEKKDEGFITLVGNQGSDFVHPVYMGPRDDDQFKRPIALDGRSEVHVPGANGDVEITEKVEKLSLEEWGKMCTENLQKSIAAFKETASELQKYEVPDAEATIEDLNQICQEFEDKSRKTNEMNMHTQTTYDRYLNELKKFTTGVLGEIRANIDKIQEELVEFRTATMHFIPTFREKMSQAISARRLKDEQIAKEKANEERRKLIEEKKAKAAEFANEAKELVAPLGEKLTDLKTASAKIVALDSPLSELASGLEETDEHLTVVNEMIESITSGVSEIQESLGDCAQFCETEMAEIRQQLTAARSQSRETVINVKAAEASKKSRAIIELAQGIKKHLIAKDQKCEQLFAAIADGKEKIDATEFVEGIKEHVSGLELSEEFQKVALSDYSQITLKDCKIISNVHYLSTIKTDMTEEIASDSSIVRSVVEGEVLEYLDGPSKEGDKDNTRVNVKALKDWCSGWVNVKDCRITSVCEEEEADETMEEGKPKEDG